MRYTACVGHWTVLTPFPGLFLHLAATERGVCALSFVESTNEFLLQQARTTGDQDWERDASPLIDLARLQLNEYFAGKRSRFEVPLDLRGTPFQEKVWRALLDIPYGETRTYAQIAAQIGSPSAVRAVGAANGANPVAIIVPCHRVVATGGGLGGYGGGLEIKKRLLALESGAGDSLFDHP